MSNKNIIEEKLAELERKSEPVTEALWYVNPAHIRQALTEVAAHQQARNIEAVGKICVRATKDVKPEVRDLAEFFVAETKRLIADTLRSQHLPEEV